MRSAICCWLSNSSFLASLSIPFAIIKPTGIVIIIRITIKVTILCQPPNKRFLIFLKKLPTPRQKAALFSVFLRRFSSRATARFCFLRILAFSFSSPITRVSSAFCCFWTSILALASAAFSQQLPCWQRLLFLALRAASFLRCSAPSTLTKYSVSPFFLISSALNFSSFSSKEIPSISTVSVFYSYLASALFISLTFIRSGSNI